MMPIPSDAADPVAARNGRCGRCGGGRRQVTRDGLKVAIRLRRVHCGQSFVEFLQVKPAIPGSITKDRGDVVPFDVRDTHLMTLGGIHHADSLNRRVETA
jgi:hypothetical protein